MFILKQITVYNYTGNNNNLSGTVKFAEQGTNGTEMSVNLSQEEVARIFAVCADSITRSATNAAKSISTGVALFLEGEQAKRAKEITQIKAPEEPQEPANTVVSEFDDEIPY